MSSCVCKSYPGYVLTVGSSGSNVADVQYYLNAIKTRYAQIPAVTVDGQYGSATQNSVRIFQQIKGLGVDGKVGWATWKAFCQELCVNPVKPVAKPYPGRSYSLGSTGNPVRDIQHYLSVVATRYPIVQRESVDGTFGNSTKYSVQLFQEAFGLPADGLVSRTTWNQPVSVFTTVDPPVAHLST